MKHSSVPTHKINRIISKSQGPDEAFLAFFTLRLARAALLGSRETSTNLVTLSSTAGSNQGGVRWGYFPFNSAYARILQRAVPRKLVYIIHIRDTPGEMPAGRCPQMPPGRYPNIINRKCTGRAKWDSISVYRYYG